MSKVLDIFPANNFKVVCNEAAKTLHVGLILGYDENGDLCVFGGGMTQGRQPVARDWLWLVEAFKHNLIRGEYAE